MRFLVVGQGGREHALVRALKFSPSVTEVHAVPGSDGMSKEAICHHVDLADPAAVSVFVKKYNFDCVVIGPEQYLVQGLSDQLRTLGVNVVGPSQIAAQLEGSKIFAKQFMVEAGVPTARYFVVSTVDETLQAAREFAPPYVLKADGLAGGKGVSISKDLAELRFAAEGLFEKKIFGAAGQRALLEEFQSGYELSFLLLTNGESFQALPVSQDHKRLSDGDIGPNTGGMGVVGPIAIPEALRSQIEASIVAPTVRHIGGSGLLYRGILYVGLMVTANGPTVIEFNVRFGDPETQVILPLLDGDWGQVFGALGRGDLVPLQWRALHAACVVLAAPGYPDAVKNNVPIEGDLGSQSTSSYFLHAGTVRSSSGQWATAGGRVLNSVGVGSSQGEALKAAYAQAKNATWPGRQMRSDIGQKAPTF